MNRAGDRQDKNFFRTERFFAANDQWFFATREAVDLGPFDSRADAEWELQMFLKTQLGLKTDAWDTPGATS